MNKVKIFFGLLIAVLFLTGCEKNKNDKPDSGWGSGVFIVNEGPFQTGSGSISAFDRETKTITDDLFEPVNGRPLGNLVQSVTVQNGKAFIAVNNANRVEIVDLESFESIGVIDSVTLPRYFVGLDDHKGYLSCWDTTVKIIDLDNLAVSGQIHTGTGPEEMLIAGSRLFVLNSGGFGIDSTITVINTATDSRENSIVVGDNPAGIQADAAGNLWILCAGKGWNGFPSIDDTKGKLVCIDPDALSILKTISFPDANNHPDKLAINKSRDRLFYNYVNGIYEFETGASLLNTEPLVMSDHMFYGLGYDPVEGMIYATDPLDYVQRGYFMRFKGENGMPADTFLVGIIPGGFWFN